MGLLAVGLIGRRWVVIETGSNQSLVFATNKQRLNVAASRLIWSVGFEWIPQAIQQVEQELGEEIEHVVRASGLGSLLASPEAGRRVIEKVTARAVCDAPDLMVWGVVGALELSASTLGQALGDAQRQLARWRSLRPSPLARDANLPYTQLCAFTGRPAVGVVSEGSADARTFFSASAGVARLWAGTSLARDSLVDRLRHGTVTEAERRVIDRAVVSAKALERGDGVADNGWIAVLHADGNGIGEIFTNLRHCYDGDELVQRLRDMSALLERCAWQAVARAIVAADDGRSTGWVLPILVGGDDITVVCHGGFGFEFTVALARVFEELLDQTLVVDSLEWIRANQEDWQGMEVTAPQRVTLAAGLVYTKAHHPFSHSVELAAQLAGSAKTLKHAEVSAMDVHVLRESAVRGLPAIREALRVGEDAEQWFELWAGPIVISASPPAPLACRHVDLVREAMTVIATPTADAEDIGRVVPSGVLHDLREALTSPGFGARARVREVGARAVAVARERDYGAALEALLDSHLVVQMPQGGFSRLLTAMDLIDVAHGTDRGRGGVGDGDG